MRLTAVLETLFRRRSCTTINTSYAVLRRRYCSTINTSYAVLRRRSSSTTKSMWYPGITRDTRYIDPSNPIASSLHTQILTQLYEHSVNSGSRVLMCNLGCRVRPGKPAEPNHLDLVKSLIEDGELDAAVSITRQFISKTGFHDDEICDLVLEAMYNAGRYEDVLRLFEFYLQKNPLRLSDKVCVPISQRSYCILIKTHFATGHPHWALDIFQVAKIDCPDP
ncbi:hypothetical protein FRX31_018536, partial [Thalictrum thalictroides]